MPEPDETAAPETVEAPDETSAMEDLLAPEAEDKPSAAPEATPEVTDEATAGSEADTATSEADTVTPVEFDDEIITWAKEYGISEEDARATGSVDALERKLAEIEFAQPAPTPVSRPESPEQPHAQPAVPGADATADTIKFESQEYLDEAFFEKLNAAFNKLEKAESTGQTEKITALESQLQGMRDYLTITGLDEQIRTHGSAYSEALGEGSTFSLDSSGDQYKARLALVPQMQAILGSYQANGLPSPSSKDLFLLAAQMKHGNPAVETARLEGAEAATKRLSQGIQRPNARPDRRGAATAAHATPNLADMVRGMAETQEEQDAALANSEAAFESQFG